MNFKNEINSRFTGGKTTMNHLADLLTKEFEEHNKRIQMIENALGLMQQAMIGMEVMINTYIGDINAKPRKRNKKS